MACDGTLLWRHCANSSSLPFSSFLECWCSLRTASREWFQPCLCKTTHEADSDHHRELQGKQRCGLYSCPNKGSLGQLKQHCWLKPFTLIRSVVYLVTLHVYIREDYLSRSVTERGSFTFQELWRSYTNS